MRAEEKMAQEEGRREKAGVRRAVFLDRDGVINRPLEKDRKPYPPTSLNEFEILPGVAEACRQQNLELEILPGVAEACRQLKEAGYLLIVATNQPDVGRGTLPQSTVEAIHAFMCLQLPIDRVEVCYH